jgi:outer membrane protein
MWSLVLALGLALAAVAVARAQAPPPAASSTAALQKIAYIDVQRVLARSAAGVAAREALERDKATMQREMDGKRVELEKLREELEKKGALLTPEARREKQDQFERKRRDAARLADDFQKELERKEALLLQKVLQDVSGIIERIGKEKGYYLVVEKRGAGVIYAAAEAYLTDEIIRAFDKQSGTKPAGGSPAAGSPAPAAAPAPAPAPAPGKKP